MIRAYEFGVMQSMTAAEFAVPIPSAGIASEGKLSGESKLGAEPSVDALNPEMAALAGMWAAIFQQQILPQSTAPAGDSLGQNSASETETSAVTASASELRPDAPANTGKETGRTPAQALTALLSRMGVAMDPVVPVQLQAEVTASAPAVVLPTISITAPAATAPAESQGSSSQVEKKDVDKAVAPNPVMAAEVPSVAGMIPLQAASVDLKVPKAHVASEIKQATDAASAKIKTDEPTATPIRGESNLVSAIRSAPNKKSQAPGSAQPEEADSEVAPLSTDPQWATQLSLRKKLIDPVGLDPRKHIAPASATVAATDRNASVDVVPVTTTSEEEANFSQISKAEELPASLPAEIVSGDTQPTSLQDQGTPRASAEEPIQDRKPTPEPNAESPKASSGHAFPTVSAEPRRADAPTRTEVGAKAPEQSTPARRTEFEAPTSLQAPQKETRTISIRIPLTDSSRASGAPTRHLDLVFAQKNNDLTLQFLSPNSEIQRNIEESIPALMDRLRTENWTNKTPDTSLMAQAAEPLLESKRRVESFVPTSSTLESFRDSIASPQATSQGFSFEDAPRERKRDAEQQNDSRNPKRDETWRDELDQLLES